MKKKVILSTGKTVEHERSKKDKNEEKGKLNLYVLFLGLAIRTIFGPYVNNDGFAP